MNGSKSDGQPDLPQGEARLLGVDRVGRTVVVTLTGGVAFEIDQQSVPAELPPVGAAVPPHLVAELAAARERKLVARDLMAMLDRRLQPVARLRGKLLDRGHDPEAVTRVLELMQDKGLCSDRQYAEAYCRDTLRGKPVGPRYLVARLRSHQVSLQVALEAVNAVMTPELEMELALQAASARWRRVPDPAEQSGLARVIRFLAGRGFAPKVAQDAARRTRPLPDNESDA